MLIRVDQRKFYEDINEIAPVNITNRIENKSIIL